MGRNRRRVQTRIRPDSGHVSSAGTAGGEVSHVNCHWAFQAQQTHCYRKVFERFSSKWHDCYYGIARVQGIDAVFWQGTEVSPGSLFPLVLITFRTRSGTHGVLSQDCKRGLGEIEGRWSKFDSNKHREMHSQARDYCTTETRQTCTNATIF